MQTLARSFARVPRPVTGLAAALGVMSLLLAIGAAINPQWIESTVGLSPDGGSGQAEWELVGVFAIAAVVLLTAALLAHRARRLAPA